MFLLVAGIVLTVTLVAGGAILAPHALNICICIMMVIVAKVIGRKYDAQLIALFGATSIGADILANFEAIGVKFGEFFAPLKSIVEFFMN